MLLLQALEGLPQEPPMMARGGVSSTSQNALLEVTSTLAEVTYAPTYPYLALPTPTWPYLPLPTLTYMALPTPTYPYLPLHAPTYPYLPLPTPTCPYLSVHA